MRHRFGQAVAACVSLWTSAALAEPAPTTAEKVDATLSFLVETAREAVWAGHRLAPALMLGLCMVISVPLFAALSRAARWSLKSLAATGAPPRDVQWSEHRPVELAVPAVRASLEVVGSPGGQFAIVRDMFRIGREDDNDIRIRSKTVQRYHAAIYREDFGAYRITDLSGCDGAGVVVNGQRCDDAQLADGDVIELGPGRLKFHAGLV